MFEIRSGLWYNLMCRAGGIGTILYTAPNRHKIRRLKNTGKQKRSRDCRAKYPAYKYGGRRMAV